MTLELTNNECKCSIVALYDLIKEKINFNIECNYDPKKILCSSGLFNTVRKYYLDNGCSSDSFAFMWVNYGPKATIEDDTKNIVEFTGDFFIGWQEEVLSKLNDDCVYELTYNDYVFKINSNSNLINIHIYYNDTVDDISFNGITFDDFRNLTIDDIINNKLQ